MNKLVPIILCLTTAFVTIPEVSNTWQDGYEYQVENEAMGEISVKEIASHWDQNSAYITIEVKCDVDAKPPRTIYITKKKNGVNYGGTLSLEGIKNRSDARYAIYSGYLYPIE